jgi:hypothetical protein
LILIDSPLPQNPLRGRSGEREINIAISRWVLRVFRWFERLRRLSDEHCAIGIGDVNSHAPVRREAVIARLCVHMERQSLAADNTLAAPAGSNTNGRLPRGSRKFFRATNY